MGGVLNFKRRQATDEVVTNYVTTLPVLPDTLDSAEKIYQYFCWRNQNTLISVFNNIR